MAQITIIGLGNPLLKDDGIGIRVVQELLREGLPSGVAAVEAARSLYLYWDLIARSKLVIVVDALKGGGPPGTLYLLPPAAIAGDDEAGVFRHGDDLKSFLDLMASFGEQPHVRIVGVEPEDLSYSLDLSPVLAGKLPDILRAVRALILEHRTGAG
ncbi:MAG: hydrogenase maturation protease [Firmicutes bacterium]|nr:hydrogenase maturation protease [Bacillota bacterium]